MAEIRLVYVSVTRAQDYLHLSYYPGDVSQSRAACTLAARTRSAVALCDQKRQAARHFAPPAPSTNGSTSKHRM